MTIKAIETKYNGYRFRSRLEARWAVFFDAGEFWWEYEPEGFDIPGFGYYLPDFLIQIPALREHHAFCYVEIKPNDGKSYENYKKMLGELCDNKTVASLFIGPPDVGKWQTFTFTSEGQIDKYSNGMWHIPNGKSVYECCAAALSARF